jgi:hypothetical protein
MLIKITAEREGKNIRELALNAKEYGRNNINVATEFLSKKGQ